MEHAQRRPLVFVSYAHEDAAVAERIERAIPTTAARWWRDVRDVLPGNYFRGDVALGIEDCDVFLLLVSDHSSRSREVLSEAELAYEQDKRIVPAYLAPLHGSLPPRLRQITAGLLRLDLYEDFDRAMGALLRVVGAAGEGRPSSARELLPLERFDTMPAAALEELVRTLQQRISSGTGDARVHAKLGEYLLHLGRPDEARPHLVQATRLDVADAVAPYLLALCLVAGRSPQFMDMPEAEAVLRLLDRADRARPGLGHVMAVAAIVTAGYYEDNGLIPPAGTSDDWWRRGRACGIAAAEQARILRSIQLTPSERVRLDALRTTQGVPS